jgi:hypothetical protein
MKTWIKLAILLVLGGTAAGLVLVPGWLHGDAGRVAHLFALGAPFQVLALEVTTEHGDLVWAIENPAGNSTEQIDYGVLPAGFEQRFPAHTPPRALRHQERLFVTAVFASRGYLRVGTRALPNGAFRHGLTVRGECSEPSCGEWLRWAPAVLEERRWTSRASGAAASP